MGQVMFFLLSFHGKVTGICTSIVVLGNVLVFGTNAAIMVTEEKKSFDYMITSV